MGNFITLGMVSEYSDSNTKFYDSASKLFNSFTNKVCNAILKYPIDSDLEQWNELVCDNSNINKVLNILLNNQYSILSFKFNLNSNITLDVICNIEIIPDNSIGLIFSIPLKNLQMYDINKIEEIFKQIMRNTINFGFDYIYCDNEVGLICDISKIFNNESTYSILLLKNKQNFSYAGWHIDGLTKRSNCP
ncbi:MAG: hypothetical protein ACI4T1_04690 [Christensenellales bacterium]